MSKLVRLSVSIEKPLLDQLEKMIKQSGYSNRSEFVRDMIRKQLVERQWEEDREVVATLTLVYDHHVRGLSRKLTHLQHHHTHGSILATTHVHLSKDLCLEVILVKAKARQVSRMADRLRQQKGVLHADLSMSSTGADLR